MDKLLEEQQINQRISPKRVKNNLYREYHMLPIQMNKVVCSNFHGKGYGCNPKYIVEELRKKDKQLDIVWLVSGDYNFPEGVRTVPFNSSEAIREIATARVLIDNQMKFEGFLKRADQFFIDTWHGAIPLKQIGYDNKFNRGSIKYYKRAHMNFSNIDLITSNSKFCTDMFRRSFRYHGLILEKGCPRNDLFVHEQSKYKNKVCKDLNLPVAKKFILYAPTFRTGKSMEAYQMDYKRVLEQLGEEWIMLIRLHPQLQNKAKKLKYTERIINATFYPDMQELMAASDILVTDYSNIMFEFALTKRPCYIFATDIEEYRKERDYYFEINNLPFPIATTSDELITAIQEFDEAQYLDKFNEFQREVQMNETGLASEYVANLIVEMTTNPEYDLQAEAHKIDGMVFESKRVKLFGKIEKWVIRRSKEQ